VDPGEFRQRLDGFFRATGHDALLRALDIIQSPTSIDAILGLDDLMTPAIEAELYRCLKTRAPDDEEGLIGALVLLWKCTHGEPPEILFELIVEPRFPSAVRDHAIETIAHYRTIPDTFKDAVRAALDDPDPAVRRSACYTISFWDDPSDLPRLEQAARVAEAEGDEKTQAYALAPILHDRQRIFRERIENLDVDAGFEVARSLLSDKDPYVRAAAIDWLRYAGDREHTAWLDCLRDDSSKVAVEMGTMTTMARLAEDAQARLPKKKPGWFKRRAEAAEAEAEAESAS
jgi:hypothetical protein